MDQANNNWMDFPPVWPLRSYDRSVVCISDYINELRRSCAGPYERKIVYKRSRLWDLSAGYSLRKLSTGFAKAALTDWKLTVISAIAIAPPAAITGKYHPIVVR